MVYKWNIKELTGYEPKTTFFTDYQLAEPFGEEAVRDTYERALKEWKDNVEFMTEMTMSINHLIWLHYDLSRSVKLDETERDRHYSLSKVYNELWGKADNYCMDNFKGKDLEYYLNVTD